MHHSSSLTYFLLALAFFYSDVNKSQLQLTGSVIIKLLIPLAVDTSGRLYDDFIRLIFVDTNRETSPLANELPEESDQFRFQVAHFGCLFQ